MEVSSDQRSAQALSTDTYLVTWGLAPVASALCVLVDGFEEAAVVVAERSAILVRLAINFKFDQNY